MKTPWLIPITFRTSKAVAQALQRQAKRLGLTRSAWINQVLAKLTEKETT